MKASILFISVLTIFCSCSSKNLMKYYYQPSKTTTIKVYKYINPENEDLTEYWKVTYNPMSKEMKTESYRSNLELYNTFEEKIYSDKALLEKYTDFEDGKDTNSTIINSDVYTNKKEQYTYSVRYKNNWGRFLIEKSRQFEKYDEIKVQGKIYKVAKFDEVYLINAIDQNQKFAYTQSSYYAKGIGMVKYERFIPAEKTRVLELKSILTENEFNILLKKTKR